MTSRGFEDVYQIDGGIVRYGETFGSKSLWKGSLYVFDERMHVEFDEETTSLGSCTNCGQSTATHRNCASPSCKTLRLFCADCAEVAARETCPTCSLPPQRGGSDETFAPSEALQVRV